ncbi:hypothetical protein [Lyngbya confervoides]|uniref:WD40 repeat-containing protein n=1 Tax=Lyngbya confervoides BDU141951 TaxID=1574623 RepID=A0ABD4T820_9CYAN|nr:hypothetical protein [Lyngbya confervoides]MCM1984415.1 hypothetical protein [Lyngbya confervoides BDU141951]
MDDFCGAAVAIAPCSTVWQWAVHTGDCLQTYCGHQQWLWSLALLEEDWLLSSSQDETIQCWNWAQYQALEVLGARQGSRSQPADPLNES